MPLRREDRRRLVEAGVVDGPSAARAITSNLLAVLATVRTPLDAELLLSEYIGIAEDAERTARARSWIAEDRRSLDHDARAAAALRLADPVLSPPPDAAFAALFGEVTASAEAAGTATALGLLRLLASFALPVADDAADAAQRLVDAGVSGPRWSEGVGRPVFVSAWRLADPFGAQESVSVAFEAAHRQHCLNVLVDHDLGGGVKDAWPAVGHDVAVLRGRAMATAGTEPNAQFTALDAAAVHDLLAPALTRAPCPRQPDQVEDVRSHLALLRSRVAHLARVISEQ